MKLSTLKTYAASAIGGALVFMALNAILPAYSNPPQDNPKPITLVLTAADVDVIINALAQRPYAESAQLINNIYAQAQKQLLPPPPDTTGKKADVPKSKKQ